MFEGGPPTPNGGRAVRLSRLNEARSGSPDVIEVFEVLIAAAAVIFIVSAGIERWRFR